MNSEIVPGASKALWHPIYDSERHTTGGHTELAFFSTPRGAGTSAHVGSGVKQLVDTNMRQGGQLSRGQRMIVMGIRVKFKPAIASVGAVTNAADMALLRHSGLLYVEIGGSKKIEQQLSDFNAGSGVDGFAATTIASTSIAQANNGAPHTENFWKLYDMPFVIEAQQNIVCNLIWPVANTPAVAWVITVQFEGKLSGEIVA